MIDVRCINIYIYLCIYGIWFSWWKTARVISIQISDGCLILCLRCMFGVYIKWPYCETKHRRIFGSLSEKLRVCWKILLKKVFSVTPIWCFFSSDFWGAIFDFSRYGWMIIGRCWDFFLVPVMWSEKPWASQTVNIAPLILAREHTLENHPYHLQYLPRTQMTSIFEGQPSKRRPFSIKTRVIWVLGTYILPRKTPRYLLKIGGWKMTCQTLWDGRIFLGAKC